MAEVVITKDNFNDVVMNAKLPVMIDFWAVWCGPCKMVAPVVAEIAAEKEGQIIVGKVNVDEEMELAQMFKIMSIPTLVLIKDGKLVSQAVGYMSKEALLKTLGID